MNTHCPGCNNPIGEPPKGNAVAAVYCCGTEVLKSGQALYSTGCLESQLDNERQLNAVLISDLQSAQTRIQQLESEIFQTRTRFATDGVVMMDEIERLQFRIKELERQVGARMESIGYCWRSSDSGSPRMFGPIPPVSCTAWEAFRRADRPATCPAPKNVPE